MLIRDFGLSVPSDSYENKSVVLLIDDDPLNIILLDSILTHQGFTTLKASNGKEGRLLAQNEQPDLILLDIMMPGENGMETCKKLMGDPATSQIPIIFLTAKSEIRDELAGLKLGAADYITKPFSPAIVLARVNNHLALKHHRDKLDRLSFIDSLTGISNRRAFDEYLLREWKRSERAGKALSLVMLDIDNFKTYNDTYGHAAGDECLKLVAQNLSDCLLKPYDFVARYGGEEFACILPETDNAGAILVAKRIRETINLKRILHSDSSIAPHITISIGVASINPTDKHDTQQFVKIADQMLYTAKKEGKNTIRWATIGEYSYETCIKYN
jgi:diguanylate cyclase (GGDEF)-like protein